MSTPRRDRISDAIERIKAWMSANGAGAIVENLAPPATAEQLAACEAKIRFELPADLRDLWSIHGGQLEEQNGFVTFMDLLGPGDAPAEDSVHMFVKDVRQHETDWEDAGVTREEILSPAWLAFASRGYADLLVISGVSGRVFWCGKDVPALAHRSASILDWIEGYAADVEAGKYVVEEGFGDVYLERA